MSLLSIFLCRNSSPTKSTSSSSFYEWQTISWPVKNYYLTASRLVAQASFGSSIGTRKGKYPVLRTNAKPQQLIKHIKISYSIASLVFRKFSCRTYRDGLNRVPQGWGTPITSNITNRVSLTPFVGNPHFNVLVHRVRYLKNLFVSRR